MALILYKNLFSIVKPELASAIIPLLHSLNNLIILFMPEQKFLIISMAHFFTGILTTYDSILRVYSAWGQGAKLGEKLSFDACLQAISSSISGLVGQEIYLKTKNYTLNFVINMTCMIISAVLSYFLYIENKKIQVETHIMGAITQMDVKTVKALICLIIFSCYSIFIRLFFQSVIRLKLIQNEDLPGNKIGNMNKGSIRDELGENIVKNNACANNEFQTGNNQDKIV